MSDWETIFKKKGKYYSKANDEVLKLIPFLRKEKVKKIFDLGCGTGRHVILLAKKGFDTYGIDISPTGLKLTRKFLKDSGLSAKLEIGDIYKRLPYKNNFFDAVISTQVIHHGTVKQIRSAIAEIERVLKPDGLAFVTVTAGFKYKKLLTRGKDFKVIAPRTYVPLVGYEVGTLHYIYNFALLRKDFKNFKILKLYRDKHNHLCILGKKKIYAKK